MKLVGEECTSATCCMAPKYSKDRRFFSYCLPSGRIGHAITRAQDATPILLWPLLYFPLAVLLVAVAAVLALLIPPRFLK